MTKKKQRRDDGGGPAQRRTPALFLFRTARSALPPQAEAGRKTPLPTLLFKDDGAREAEAHALFVRFSDSARSGAEGRESSIVGREKQGPSLAKSSRTNSSGGIAKPRIAGWGHDRHKQATRDRGEHAPRESTVTSEQWVQLQVVIVRHRRKGSAFDISTQIVAFSFPGAEPSGGNPYTP